ncbi:pumilio homolog 2 isoform X4 [Homalodisca vitripennis]|nr:pumilio homolog 2 isoform X4 [Homalodisca vitripennis]
MKWLGEGDSEMLSQSNGPQPVQPAPSLQQVSAEAARPQVLSRSQDDAMVGYVFQRPHSDPDFPLPPGLKQQSRWPLVDDSAIDHNQEKWKYPVAKMPVSMNSVPYEIHPLVMKPGSEHFLYHHMTQPPPHMAGILPPDMNPRNGQIAPSAKKLWGVEEPKDEPKGILSLNDHQMWRDSTWSTSDHAVSQPITMVARRSGSFPGSEAGNILSPRSSETSGLGVKMVEYVLGTSPTNKDLEPQMRRLVMVRNQASNDPNEKKEKEKAPSSPYDTANKKEHENGVVPQNGVQNGLDDDKGFNRTPGSRQPSPSDEELNKNNGVVVLENPHVSHHYPHPFPPPPHPHTLAHLDSHFEHVMTLDPSFEGPPTQQQPTQQQAAMDSPTVLSTSFDVQQLFRNQNTAVNPAQQIQLLQQQQYQHLAATQQQQQLAGLAPAPGATFAPATPYIINPQEPYVIAAAGPTVMPQYYSMPWGVYPANIIQQGTTTQQRRPLTPSSASENPSNLPQVQPSQYQVIPAYYDQNGSMVIRSISAGAPQTMRLVSPAPVLVNAGTPGSSMRLLGSQTQQITTPPSSIYSGTQPASLYSTPTANGTTISGLGLSTGSTGRRDSFDRNTSAFSPSLEYGRQKWPQNYGALGTVTASPSPLGLASGSVSPPPTLGSSAGLQLGALTTSANRTLLSAAPGAEAMTKFRAAGTMLGTNSLFAKLGTVPRTLGGGGTSPLETKPTGRSRLLEDFRNNRYPSLQLRDLANHIVEFSQDQHGSRFIQQKLERATVPEKQLVFSEIIAAAYNLMTDVFGNYVIQKFFEFGTADQKTTLAQKVRGHVLPLALQMYGCRVIQKALESISGEQQVEIVRELDGHVLKCVKDQNGNHVVQKCIECVDPHALQFIINAFQGQVFALSTHPYGCRVIQRILEHCTQEQTAPILEELHQHTDQLIQDQYGNYVIQHVLEHGKPEDKSLLIGAVRGKVLALSQHKFASNVVEKCVTHATRAERAILIEEVCGFNDNALHVMMKDQYANYVVQKMLDVCEAAQRKVLMHKIRPHFASLRKYTYGKHIIAKLEKFFMKSNNVVSDLGPIGPPTNGVL